MYLLAFLDPFPPNSFRSARRKNRDIESFVKFYLRSCWGDPESNLSIIARFPKNPRVNWFPAAVWMYYLIQRPFKMGFLGENSLSQGSPKNESIYMTVQNKNLG